MSQDILITPGSGEPQILFRGSGTIDTAVELNVLSSYQSATGSGTALLFEGEEGLLFGVTDNLSSGTIFSVADISGLPALEYNASGELKIGEYASSTVLYTDNGVYLSGDIPAITTGALYSSGGALHYNGSPVSVSYSAGSGLVLTNEEFNIYGGTGNFQQLDITSANTFTPKIVFTGSGVTDTPVTLKVLSSHASASSSGTALSFEGTEGQLFGLTDNLSSGVIFSVNDITGLPAIAYNASGELKLGEYAKNVTLYGGVKTTINEEVDGATITFDMDESNVHMATLAGDRTLAVTNVDAGQRFMIRLTQDVTGSRTVTWWNNISWSDGGTEPTLTTTGGQTDLFGFLCTSGNYYDGFVCGQDI